MTKSKLLALPKLVSDGSGRQTAFNDGSWGGPTRGYLMSAKNLKSKSFDEIIQKAKVLSRAARQTSTKVPVGTGKLMAINDHRATLVDESASEEEDKDKDKDKEDKDKDEDKEDEDKDEDVDADEDEDEDADEDEDEDADADEDEDEDADADEDEDAEDNNDSCKSILFY